jgi:hypothetical protein
MMLSKKSGPHNAKYAMALLGGKVSVDYLNGAIAAEHSADAMFEANPGISATNVRLRHYLAYKNYLTALTALMDARQGYNPMMLHMKLAMLNGINFIEGGSPLCDEDSHGHCYQGIWRPSGAGNIHHTIPMNWSSSLYRVAIMNYGSGAELSHGDIRAGLRPGGSGSIAPIMPMFPPINNHYKKYARPLEPGAMTRPEVQLNAKYGSEFFARKKSVIDPSSTMWPQNVNPPSGWEVLKPLLGLHAGGFQVPFFPSGDSAEIKEIYESVYESNTPIEPIIRVATEGRITFGGDDGSGEDNCEDVCMLESYWDNIRKYILYLDSKRSDPEYN